LVVVVVVVVVVEGRAAVELAEVVVVRNVSITQAGVLLTCTTQS